MAKYRRCSRAAAPSANMRRKIFESLGGRCAYCGCYLDYENFHVDHATPVSKGGKGGKNRVPTCPLCNLCKGPLDVEEFREKIENIFSDNDSGKVALIKKFYNVKLKKKLFYFEEAGWQITDK